MEEARDNGGRADGDDVGDQQQHQPMQTQIPEVRRRSFDEISRGIEEARVRDQVWGDQEMYALNELRIAQRPTIFNPPVPRNRPMPRRSRWWWGAPDNDGNNRRDCDNGVFLIPADDRPCEAPGSVRPMSAVERAAMHPPTLHDILYTASVLVQCCKCPVDVVGSILAFAGLFLTLEQTTDAVVHGRNSMDDEYVRLTLPTAPALVQTLPPGVSATHCVAVVVETESKDQGWASGDQRLNGTYEASCTWFDVVVQRSVENAAEAAEVTRVRAFCNVRASRRFRRHVKWFVDPTGLVGSVALGDAVSLVLRSLYPGWANSARFGRVRAQFALELDDAFDAAAVAFPAYLAAGLVVGAKEEEEEVTEMSEAAAWSSMCAVQ